MHADHPTYLDLSSTRRHGMWSLAPRVRWTFFVSRSEREAFQLTETWVPSTVESCLRYIQGSMLATVRSAMR